MPGKRLSNPATLFLLRDFKCLFINKTDTYWNLNMSAVFLKCSLDGCQSQSLNKNDFFFSEVTTLGKCSENFIIFDFHFDKDWLDTRYLVGKTSLTHFQNFLGFNLFSSIKFLLCWLQLFSVSCYIRVFYLDQSFSDLVFLAFLSTWSRWFINFLTSSPIQGHLRPLTFLSIIFACWLKISVRILLKRLSHVFMSVSFKTGCQSTLLKSLFIDSELYVL